MYLKPEPVERKVLIYHSLELFVKRLRACYRHSITKPNTQHDTVTTYIQGFSILVFTQKYLNEYNVDTISPRRFCIPSPFPVENTVSDFLYTTPIPSSRELEVRLEEGICKYKHFDH